MSTLSLDCEKADRKDLVLDQIRQKYSSVILFDALPVLQTSLRCDNAPTILAPVRLIHDDYDGISYDATMLCQCKSCTLAMDVMDCLEDDVGDSDADIRNFVESYSETLRKLMASARCARVGYKALCCVRNVKEECTCEVCHAWRTLAVLFPSINSQPEES
jgi:hypothetical protein